MIAHAQLLTAAAMGLCTLYPRHLHALLPVRSINSVRALTERAAPFVLPGAVAAVTAIYAAGPPELLVWMEVRGPALLLMTVRWKGKGSACVVAGMPGVGDGGV
jgi:hypothetical protein